ncbi:MAG: nucleotidyltransferase family protein [Dysgonamonadaceae bacterium]|jgi:hypothetical protein|nr:nucleotidyltransferase family protein [Dysgonamonadaceae bacterium]
MEWNVTYKAFFALLRAGLWNREPDDGCFPLSPEVWEQVYRLAHQQTVQGIVYDGIMHLPDNYFPSRDLLLKWVVSVNAIEDRNKRMNRDAGELYSFFSKNQIEVFLVKGQGLASCYDNPLHRVCGDMDWVFPDKEHFNRANRLIKERGIKVETQPGFDTCYTWRGFLIEHHRRMLDINNPFSYSYLNRIQQKEYSHSIYLEVNGQKIPTPSPLLTYLSVNTHIMRHLLAFGINVRQLCDSARICYAYQDRTEGKVMKEIYNKLGIYNWIQRLNQLSVTYLGMPEEYLPFPLAPQQNADEMMMDFLHGVDYGFYINARSGRLKRKSVFLDLLVRFARYVRYVPGEACWFPIIHGYSHIKNWFDR